MKTWKIAGLTCALVASLTACAHSGDSQVLQFRGAVQPLRSGDYCLASDTTRLIGHAVFDLALAKSYRFFPALQSLMVPLSTIPGMNPSVKDTNIINLTSMDVSILSGVLSTTPFNQPSGAGVTSKLPGSSWSVPVTGTIVSGGLLITPADLVPEKALVGSKFVAIGEDWRSRFFTAAANKDFSKTEIVLSFQIRGTTLSGDNVITDAVTVPMTVCYGCLLTPAQTNPVTDAANFWAGCGAATIPADFVAPCNPGQDDYADCRLYCHECQKSVGLKEKVKYNGCDPTLCPP